MPDPVASRDKTIARVEKLLRLAAPGSRATDAERASAALEIVRLILECDLRLIANEKKSVKEPPKTWKASIAARRSACFGCGGTIAIGEEIWMRSAGFAFDYTHPECCDR